MALAVLVLVPVLQQRRVVLMGLVVTRWNAYALGRRRQIRCCCRPRPALRVRCGRTRVQTKASERVTSPQRVVNKSSCMQTFTRVPSKQETFMIYHARDLLKHATFHITKTGLTRKKLAHTAERYV